MGAAERDNVLQHNDLPDTVSGVQVYLDQLGDESRAGMRRSLDQLARAVWGSGAAAMTAPWSGISYRQAIEARAALASRLAPATVNKCLAGMRRVLREEHALGRIPDETYRLLGRVKDVRRPLEVHSRYFTREEVRRLLAVCQADDSLFGVRDLAVLALLYGAGLRRSEAAKLALSDWSDGLALVRSGKGSRRREVPLAPALARLVDAWVVARKAWPGPLLCSLRGGRLRREPLVPDALLRVVKRRMCEAGVTPGRSAHSLRHSFITHLLEDGSDLLLVMGLAGHTDPKITRRYDHRTDGAKRRATEGLGAVVEGS